MRLLKLFIMSVIVFSSLVGCKGSEGTSGESTVKTEQQIYNENLEKWKSHSLIDYTITTSSSCFCLPEAEDGIVINVRANTVEDAYYIPSIIYLDEDSLNGLKTIDEYFEIIQLELDEQNLDYVIYNEEYGFPETISYGEQYAAVDGQVILYISSFE